MAPPARKVNDSPRSCGEIANKNLAAKYGNIQGEGVTQIRAALATTPSDIKGVSVITACDNVSDSMVQLRELGKHGTLHNTHDFGTRVNANLCVMCTHAYCLIYVVL